MLKKLAVILLILTLFVACGKGKGSSTDNDANGISKKQFLNYIQKTLEYYQSEEYQNMAATYKKEAKGIKKIMDRQKVWNKYMKPAGEKVKQIMKECGITTSDLMKARNYIKTDKEIAKKFWKMSKYVVY